MRSSFVNKFLIILLSVLTVGALMGLSIGLRNVSFHQAQAFSKNEPRTDPSVPLGLIDNVISIPLSTQFIIWISIVILVFLIGVLLSPEMRKHLIRFLIRFVITYWAMWIFFTRYRQVLEQMGLGPASQNGNPNTPASNGVPMPEFTPPQPVSWVAYLISFVVIAALIFAAWRLNAIWKKLNAPAADLSLKKLAGIARSSLLDLSAGRDSTDVIMNCYYRMSDVVLDKKQINRNLSTTPSEFAMRLEQAGLPGDAVRRLTRLFEAVRYGAHKSDPAAVNEAVACLTKILHHCGEAV
jgi:Domain of unknown function (DUF4129)